MPDRNKATEDEMEAQRRFEAGVPMPVAPTPEPTDENRKLRAERLEQALRGLALAASEFLHVTLCDKISDTATWRKLSGAVTRALEAADAK
jgi:hypothetical protein